MVAFVKLLITVGVLVNIVELPYLDIVDVTVNTGFKDAPEPVNETSTKNANISGCIGAAAATVYVVVSPTVTGVTVMFVPAATTELYKLAILVVVAASICGSCPYCSRSNGNR